MKKIFSRLASLVSRRAAAVATAVFGVALAATALLPGGPIQKARANTPVFNNLADDYPALSARVNGQGQWQKQSVSLKDGDYVQFMLWAHNTELNTVAANTRVQALLPTADGLTASVNGQVWADNAAAVKNAVAVNLASAGHLEIDANTVHSYRFDQSTGQFIEVPTNNPGSVITAAGLNLGDMQGCWDYMRAVTFSARVVKQLNPDVTTYKEVARASVQNNWSNTRVAANPGEVIDFHVYLENTGADGSTLLTPKVVDVLDSHLTYKPGSAYMITRDANGSDVRFNIPDSLIGQSGQQLTFSFSDMSSEARQAIHLYFQATLSRGDAFPIGTTAVCNVATASGNGPAGAVSKGTNQVCVDVTKDVNPIYSATILKVVRNLTTASLWQGDVPVAASPGDTVQWELRVTNTGNRTTDMIVADTLPAYLSLDRNILLKGAAAADSAFAPASQTGTVTIGADNFSVRLPVVNPGNVNGYVIRFNTTVSQSIPAGQHLLINNGTVQTGDKIQDQDDAQILVGAASDFVLDKKVLDPQDGQWKDATATAIRPSDRVRYRIDVINTGNTELSVSSIRDVLPQYIRYVDNTLVIDTHIVAGGSPVTTDEAFFSSTGITGFKLLPGVTKRFEFEAAAVACPSLGTYDQTNTAFITAAGRSANDTATIRLTVAKPNPAF